MARRFNADRIFATVEARESRRQQGQIARNQHRLTIRNLKRANRQILRAHAKAQKAAQRAVRKAFKRAIKTTKEEAEIAAIARSIQLHIFHHGTKPTHYMKGSLPKLGRILGVLIKRRVKDQ
jgi:hypothetical protein